MRKEYASLRRRPFLTPVWIAVFVGVLALAVAAWAVHAASTTLVVVTRHAEKAEGGGQDPDLGLLGEQRSLRLAQVLAGGGTGHSVDAIFVTEWRRTAQSARPLATRLGVPVITVAAEDVDGLVDRILREYRGRRVLVIGHSNTVPAIVRRLARGSSVPAIGEDEYGTAYVVAVPRWSRPTVLGLALP